MMTRTELMAHQAQAVDKLMRTRVGALFMDMGTGKTRTAIELIARRAKRIDRVVFFCPVSARDNIAGEIFKHTDASAEDVHVFNDRTSQRTAPRDAYWYIVGIESMSASRRVILAANSLVTTRTCAIVDESSYIKGHRAARTDWITRVCARARYRLVLTGTPISQGVEDLFSQMRFLSSKVLGYNSFYSFARNHLEYSEHYPGLVVRSHNTDWLAAKMKPYVYQVTAEECLDLPDQLRETEYCRMSWEQEDAYEEAKRRILQETSPDEWDSLVIFRLFTALQGIVSGFRRHENGVEPLLSHRPEALARALERIPAPEKAIIWAKYLYDVEQITAMLDQRYGPQSYSVHTGRLRPAARADALAAFRADRRFLVATPTTGGYSLTLNEAAYSIFYTSSFKHSERQQAERRCYRIGQDRPVTYIDIVCMNSIDSRIQAALSTKGDAVQQFRASLKKAKNAKSKRELINSL